MLQRCKRHNAVSCHHAGSVAPDSQNAQLFVVDPCFKDSFLLPNATPSYSRLCDALPNIFVGTAEQLVPLVEFMCSQV